MTLPVMLRIITLDPRDDKLPAPVRGHLVGLDPRAVAAEDMNRMMIGQRGTYDANRI